MVSTDVAGQHPSSILSSCRERVGTGRHLLEGTGLELSVVDGPTSTYWRELGPQRKADCYLLLVRECIRDSLVLPLTYKKTYCKASPSPVVCLVDLT